MPDRVPYAYLVSTSHSGSTLLCMLMNAHPQVASVGELSNMIGEYIRIGKIEQYLCSCGQEIKECKFWSKIKERCRQKKVVLDLHNFDTNLDAGLGFYVNANLDAGLGYYVNRFLFGVPGRFPIISRLRAPFLSLIPAHQRVIKRIMHRKLTIAQAILEETGKKLFFDGSKGLTQAKHLSENDDLDFKLVHLVRDPRGFVNSFCKRKGQERWKEGAKIWAWTNGAVLRSLKPEIPAGSYLLARYEKLCESPEKMLSEICQFLGLQPIDLVSAVNERPHHIIGNRMRLRKFHGIRLDRLWQENLTPEQLRECVRITGDVAKEIGYELESS
jgi:hypothetical protein